MTVEKRKLGDFILEVRIKQVVPIGSITQNDIKIIKKNKITINSLNTQNSLDSPISLNSQAIKKRVFGRGCEFVSLANLLTLSEDEIRLSIFYATQYFMPYAIKTIKFIESFEETDKLEKVFNLALKHLVNSQINHTNLLRYSHMSSRDFNETVDTLVFSGRFRRKVVKPLGREKKFYIPLNPDGKNEVFDYKIPKPKLKKQKVK